jgi:hypothetical protein
LGARASKVAGSARTHRYASIAAAKRDTFARTPCPHGNSGDEDATATQLLLQGVEDLATEELYQFAQLDGRLPTKMWILLDNQQSTVKIFYNKALLKKDIRKTTRCMRVRCNAGRWTVTNLLGRLPGYPGKVWYNPDGIANILSLAC